MILVISDTHTCYETINQQIEHAENSQGVYISCVVHLGDIGIFKPELHNFFIKQGRRFIRPVYFLEGNHEDFDAMPWLVKKYRKFFTHLPKGAVHSIRGYRFLCLGGAAYMDSMITQQGAVITDRHIDSCLTIDREKVDIILTHDCPGGIGVPNSLGLEYYGDTGFERGDELAHHFKPKLWLFGHHHKWFECYDTHTKYYGMAESWNGFGLLGDNYQFKVVHNRVQVETKPRPFIDRLLVKLKIIR